MVTLRDFLHRLKSWNLLVQHNKQYHRKVLLSSFNMIDHRLGHRLLLPSRLGDQFPIITRLWETAYLPLPLANILLKVRTRNVYSKNPRVRT